MTSPAAARSRRRARFRATALPTFLLTVKPSRRLCCTCSSPSSASEAHGRICKTRPGVVNRRLAPATRRNSARRFRRPTAAGMRSGRQALATLGAAVGHDAAAADGRHAGPEAVAPFAHEFARLIGPFHRYDSVVPTPAPGRRNQGPLYKRSPKPSQRRPRAAQGVSTMAGTAGSGGSHEPLTLAARTFTFALSSLKSGAEMHNTSGWKGTAAALTASKPCDPRTKTASSRQT